MQNERILILTSDPALSEVLDQKVLRPAGFDAVRLQGRRDLNNRINPFLTDVLILDESPDGTNGLELGVELLQRYPTLAIILLVSNPTTEDYQSAIRAGFSEVLQTPIRSSLILDSVRRGLERGNRLADWGRLQAKRNTQSLEQRVQSLEALQKIGRQVTSLLNLDSILAAVVEAAVELTQAEEGSLLLLDETSGELYMRAARNFQEDYARTFRLPTQDTLAGQVLQTGEPVLVDDTTPQKIKTSYLVHALIYVPLVVKDRVIGVLGVDNRHAGQRFSEYHLALVSTLGEYAAIAIENARLYAASERERSQLETILTGVEDGVLVIDRERRVLLINHTARKALGISSDLDVHARPAAEILHHAELLEMVSDELPTAPYRVELTLEDGRVMNTQFTPIAAVGLIIIMQDITHLKELDRIKSDFVSTVSHDLRSPLTAILGYVELLERVGPVNDMQREFIRRVETSVQSITALINDLLDLGRIEAGFDSRKEVVPVSPLVRFSLDGLTSRAVEKSQNLILEVPENLPGVLGNPVRLRQMISNLVGNALKYTQAGGSIWVRGRTEADQVILEVADNGPGIPASDQPYIFDKFFRASNTPESTPGTGLGLAIVKSIVENHQGRIWFESAPGQGTIFTVVLPIAKS